MTMISRATRVDGVMFSPKKVEIKNIEMKGDKKIS